MRKAFEPRAVVRRFRRTRCVAVSIVVAGFAAAGWAPSTGEPSTAAVRQGAQEGPLAADLDLLQRADAARQLGSPSDVVIEEFFDYACPTCAEFHRRSGADLAAFVERENVLFIAHVFPLPRLMRGYQGAEAAFCAGALGGSEAFFAMHDRILNGQDAWRTLPDPSPVLAGYAAEVGVDMDAYRDCVARDAMAPLIIADLSIGAARRIAGTPTFIFKKTDAELISAVLSNADAFDGFPRALAQTRGR